VIWGDLQRDERIKIPTLNLLGQFLMLFRHFEKYFDIPALAINTDEILISQFFLRLSRTKTDLAGTVSLSRRPHEQEGMVSKV
jgi:hypothetical protein